MSVKSFQLFYHRGKFVFNIFQRELLIFLPIEEVLQENNKWIDNLLDSLIKALSTQMHFQ